LAIARRNQFLVGRRTQNAERRTQNAERRTQNAERSWVQLLTRGCSIAALLAIAMITSQLSAFGQAPTVIFDYPTNNAIGVSFRPTIRLKTHYKIDTTSLVRSMADRDSLDPSLPTVMLVPKILADSFPSAVKYSTIRGKYTFVNDTTLEFQSHADLFPQTKYMLIVGTLNVLVPTYTGPGFDTVAVQQDTITFTTLNYAYRLLGTSYSSKGYILCGDTLSLRFNRKLLAATSPLDSALISLKRFDSVEYINDSTSVQHTTSVPLTVWVEPTDSTILRALPDSTFAPEKRYFVTARASELTGEPSDDITTALIQKSYYQVTMNIKSYDTSYSVPSYCSVFPGDKATFTMGDTVTINATADSNFLFLRWESTDIPSIDSSLVPSHQLNAVYSCNAIKDIAMTAVFIRKDTITVTVGDTTNLTVAVYNDTNAYLGGAGTYRLPPDQILYTVATPDSGYTFSIWNAQSIGQIPSVEERSEMRVAWRNNGTEIAVGPDHPVILEDCNESKICVHVVAADENGGTCNPKGNREKLYNADKEKNLYSSYVNPNDIVNVYIDHETDPTPIPFCRTKTPKLQNFHVRISIKENKRGCWELYGVYDDIHSTRPKDYMEDPEEKYEYANEFKGNCPKPTQISFHLRPITRKLTVTTTIENPGTIEAIGNFIENGNPKPDKSKQPETDFNKEVIVRVWKQCRTDAPPIAGIPYDPTEWVEITQNKAKQIFNLPCSTLVRVNIDWIDKNKGNEDFSFVKWICEGDGKNWKHPYGSECYPANPANLKEFFFIMDDDDLDVEGVVNEQFRLARVALIEANGGQEPNRFYRPQKLLEDEFSGHKHDDLNITHQINLVGHELSVPTKVTKIGFQFSHGYTYSSVNNTKSVNCQENSARIDWLPNGLSPKTLNYSPESNFNAVINDGIGSNILNLWLAGRRGTDVDGIPHAEDFITNVTKGVVKSGGGDVHLYKDYVFNFTTEMPGLQVWVKEITPLGEQGDGNIELFSYGKLMVMNDNRVVASSNINLPYCNYCGRKLSDPDPFGDRGFCYDEVQVGATKDYGINDYSIFYTSHKMKRQDLIAASVSSFDYDMMDVDCWDIRFEGEDNKDYYDPDRDDGIGHLIRTDIREWAAGFAIIVITALSIASAIILENFYKQSQAVTTIGRITDFMGVLYMSAILLGVFIVGFSIWYAVKESSYPDPLGTTAWGVYDWARNKFGAKPIDSPKTSGTVKHKLHFKLKRDSDIP